MAHILLHTKTAQLVVVLLETKSVVDVVIDPANAFAGATLAVTGELTTNPGGEDPDEWALPRGGGTGDDYDCRLVYVSGATPNGEPVDTWLQINTLRAWSISQTVIGQKDFGGTMEIRPTGGGPTIDSAGWNFTAKVISGK